MKPAIAFVLILLLTSFLACNREEDPYHYPVWILYTRVVEEVSDIGIPYAPVRGCPRATFRVIPNGSDSTVGCHENSNVVKIWDHIDSVITIEYYVSCQNYYDSDPVQVTFRASDAVQGPGREGPEDIEIDTTILTPI